MKIIPRFCVTLDGLPSTVMRSLLRAQVVARAGDRSLGPAQANLKVAKAGVGGLPRPQRQQSGNLKTTEVSLGEGLGRQETAHQHRAPAWAEPVSPRAVLGGGCIFPIVHSFVPRTNACSVSGIVLGAGNTGVSLTGSEPSFQGLQF